MFFSQERMTSYPRLFFARIRCVQWSAALAGLQILTSILVSYGTLKAAAKLTP
jgi:hypothetical protein